MKLFKNKDFAASVAFSFTLAVLELIFLKLDVFFQALFFFTTLTLPPILLFFYKEYLIEKKQSEIDAFLPPALFQIASFPSSTPTEKTFDSIAKGDFGALSGEFALALKQIKTGYSVREALEEMKKRNSSLLLRRTCDLMLKSYRSGAKTSGEMFKDIAEDVYSLQEIVRETAASLSMQKYTLLIGGSVLVPIVLALLFNISASLQEGFSEDLLGFTANPALQNTILWANQLYLAIFALVASLFIARVEEKPRKAVLYFAVMAPLALILFNLVRGAIIL
ncbi:MAG: type II secretion system F family protein [Candidatus Micrarchaeota archaeon]